MTLTFAKRSSRASWPRRDRVTAYAFVAGQAVLLATVFGPARHRHRDPAARTATVLAVGSGAALATIAAAQLGRQLTALPLPTDDAQLRTTGIYGQVRHPIYTGVMLAGLARAAASGSPTRLAAAGLLAGLLNAKATWEERKLAARFPGYGTHARRTPKFLPCPRPRSERRGDDRQAGVPAQVLAAAGAAGAVCASANSLNAA